MSVKVISELEVKLDRLFARVEPMPEDDIKAKLAEYLCIRISGLLESVIKQLVNEFLDGSVPQEANKYIVRKMQTVTNLTDDKLLKLLESFSTDWEVEFKKNVTAQEISSLNSIIHLRNGMAHGGSQSVSYRTVKAHYDNIKQLIERLKTIIAKHPKKAGKKQKVA
jgi:hypothetical protein